MTYKILLVPPDYLTEVVGLIDYMGWQDVCGVTLDKAQLECAERVWLQVGKEPDYIIRDTQPTWDVMYAIRFYSRDDDADVMIAALNDYISSKYTAKTVDLSFRIGGRANLLSGRLMFFFDGDANPLGHVYHRLDGWWVVNGHN